MNPLHCLGDKEVFLEVPNGSVYLCPHQRELSYELHCAQVGRFLMGMHRENKVQFCMGEQVLRPMSGGF